MSFSVREVVVMFVDAYLFRVGRVCLNRMCCHLQASLVYKYASELCQIDVYIL